MYSGGFLTLECCLVLSQTLYKVLSTLQIYWLCQPVFEPPERMKSGLLDELFPMKAGWWALVVVASVNSLLIESYIHFSTALPGSDVRPVSPTWKHERFILLDLFGYWLREELYSPQVLHPASVQHVHCYLSLREKSVKLGWWQNQGRAVTMAFGSSGSLGGTRGIKQVSSKRVFGLCLVGDVSNEVHQGR